MLAQPSHERTPEREPEIEVYPPLWNPRHSRRRLRVIWSAVTAVALGQLIVFAVRYVPKNEPWPIALMLIWFAVCAGIREWLASE